MSKNVVISKHGAIEQIVELLEYELGTDLDFDAMKGMTDRRIKSFMLRRYKIDLDQHNLLDELKIVLNPQNASNERLSEALQMLTTIDRDSAELWDNATLIVSDYKFKDYCLKFLNDDDQEDDDESYDDDMEYDEE